MAALKLLPPSYQPLPGQKAGRAVTDPSCRGLLKLDRINNFLGTPDLGQDPEQTFSAPEKALYYFYCCSYESYHGIKDPSLPTLPSAALSLGIFIRPLRFPSPMPLLFIHGRFLSSILFSLFTAAFLYSYPFP